VWHSVKRNMTVALRVLLLLLLLSGADLRTALDATLAGSALPSGFTVKPSIGCNIKWAPGKEPDYYGTQIIR